MAQHANIEERGRGELNVLLKSASDSLRFFFRSTVSQLCRLRMPLFDSVFTFRSEPGLNFV